MYTTSCATACVETAASMITKTPLTHANGISCVEATSFLTNDRKSSAGFDPSEVSRVILKPSTFYFLLDACLSWNSILHNSLTTKFYYCLVLKPL